MFTVYHSNHLSLLKDKLIEILQQQPTPSPFAQETVLVQSLGMAQWLQMQIAESVGVCGGIQFPYPTRFVWDQYRTLFPELPKENLFAQHKMVWHLMRLLPEWISHTDFAPLQRYLHEAEPLKYYQLALKIADLFDQYLVYRPHWLVHWEKGELQAVKAELKFAKPADESDIQANLRWQSTLWNVLMADIRHTSDEQTFYTSHRAYLQKRYFDKLDQLSEAEKVRLPSRIFVFGISSLPVSQLATLAKLSEHAEVHLFFGNPCMEFWGDNREEAVLEKMVLNAQISPEEFAELFSQQGNPLLAGWGKQGREFLNLLTALQPNEQDLYHHFEQENSQLACLKRTILGDLPRGIMAQTAYDGSIQFHSCHSMMREVEVLHNQLLHFFEQDPTLSPKDIIVMSPDIDHYAPYIQAVFSREPKQDPRAIPFALSDQKISQISPIIASFLHFFRLKESTFSAEEVLTLLEVEAIREKFQLNQTALSNLRHWINDVGIRAGSHIDEPQWQNFNSWENGLNRLLQGSSLKSEHGLWQGTIAFDESYGLAAEQIGHLAEFWQELTAWHHFISQPQRPDAWQIQLKWLLQRFYLGTQQESNTLLQLEQAIDTLFNQIADARFDAPLTADVLAMRFEEMLGEQRSNLNFLVGKVNFCTLLPMRAIPFKVVCLLGMNEGDFPRQQHVNSFDLMQYAPQKGDRAKRDDDRYLFLEALLAAQQIFYVSYIGQSLTSNQPKLPSILVSQLQNYLGAVNEMAHPMTVFSPKNLQQGYYSYDREWFQLKQNPQQAVDFLQKLATPAQERPDVVEIDDLIAFLQHPLKWFFQRQLGVRFEQKEQAIEETESFVLNSLSRYQLLEAWFEADEASHTSFFEAQKRQGKLPAGHFADLAEQVLSTTRDAFLSELEPYLSQTAEKQEIVLPLFVSGRKIQLEGYLKPLFGRELVGWRVGKWRDKDAIQQWIYQRLIAASETGIHRQIFYAQGKNGVERKEWQQLATEQAKAQLSQYLHDYLLAFEQPVWAVTENLESYLKKAPADESEWGDYCRQALEQTEDPYIKRAIQQSGERNYATVHRQTVAWFGSLFAHSSKVE